MKAPTKKGAVLPQRKTATAAKLTKINPTQDLVERADRFPLVMKYRLKIGCAPLIIEEYAQPEVECCVIFGGKWWWLCEDVFGCGRKICSGNTIVYPELDLLWISLPEENEGAKTVEDFELEFTTLPRWKTSRYAIVENANHMEDDGSILSYALFLYDCRSGDALTYAAGREAEVERLRRGIEPMMRGEDFGFH